MSPEELAQLIAFGREVQRFEVKRSGPLTNAQFFAKIAKALMALANTRDGGHVIIGVNDTGTALVPEGIQPARFQWKSFMRSLFSADGTFMMTAVD